MRLIGIIIGLVFALLLHLANSASSLLPSEDECGKVKVDSFFSLAQQADAAEYPWIARIGFRYAEQLRYTALAVLISRRYLLSAGSIYGHRDSEAEHVLLGSWNTSDSIQGVHCQAQSACMEVPTIYELEEIAVHPDLRSPGLGSDIAVLRLKRDVTFNDYVRPICMPLAEPMTDTYAGQFLHHVGFERRFQGREYVIKTIMLVMGSAACQATWSTYDLGKAENYLCGVTDTVLLSGAPIMNVEMKDGVPQRFRLIALRTVGAQKPGSGRPDISTRVHAFREWIEQNMIE